MSPVENLREDMGSFSEKNAITPNSYYFRRLLSFLQLMYYSLQPCSAEMGDN
jgi:hypothetical protein